MPLVRTAGWRHPPQLSSGTAGRSGGDAFAPVASGRAPSGCRSGTARAAVRGARGTAASKSHDVGDRGWPSRMDASPKKSPRVSFARSVPSTRTLASPSRTMKNPPPVRPCRRTRSPSANGLLHEVDDAGQLGPREVAEEGEPGERVDELLASGHAASIFGRLPVDGTGWRCPHRATPGARPGDRSAVDGRQPGGEHAPTRRGRCR